MTNSKRNLWGLLALLPLLAACGGLSSEPEIAVEMPMPTAAPQAELASAPAGVPDTVRGAAFYADHCVMCHGTGGQGDGEMVADGRLQTPPPDFTDPATMQDKSPADFLRAITEGNVLAGMPPFASYSEEDRWDVAAYVYGGGLTADQVAVGQAIYEASCASCHGPEGRGDGPEAPQIMPDLASLEYWGQSTNAAVLASISQGTPPVMPAFADQLDASELAAVTAYVRALAVPRTAGFGGGTTAVARRRPPKRRKRSARQPASRPPSRMPRPASRRRLKKSSPRRTCPCPTPSRFRGTCPTAPLMPGCPKARS